LSKNPSFSGWLQSLKREFPDARFIGLLRKPDETLPSQLSSVRGVMAWFGYDVQQTELVRRFVELFASYYTHVTERLSDLSPQEARLVRYADLKSAPADEVTCTLRRLGYTVGDEYFRQLFIAAEQAREYRSRHRYTLSEFGLTERQLRQQFSSAYAWCTHGAEQHVAPLLSKEDAKNAGDIPDAAQTS
jgi:hypothetical protein